MISERNFQSVDYGPLTALIGTWQGTTGKDISPEKVGHEENIYQEKLIFQPVGTVSNAEEQDLVSLQYHQSVNRISDDKMIHNESGYLSWDSQLHLLIKSFSIPRGVAVIAGGQLTVKDGHLSFEVKARLGDSEWGIIQSPFMQKKALTQSYAYSMSVENNRMSYSQIMELDIYGRSFSHTDCNHLIRA